MFRRWPAAAVAAAGIAAAATMIGLPASAASGPAAAHASVTKPAKLDPFTGKYTTIYETKGAGLDAVTYYEWPYAASNSWCVYSGSAVGDYAILDPCNSSSKADFWTYGTWGGTTKWSSDGYLKNEQGNLCIDDPTGEDNVRLPVETCAAVGGQAFNVYLPQSYDDSWEYLNQIAEKESITLDYGTVKDGAWIVSNPVDTAGTNNDEFWAGPGDQNPVF